MYDLDVGATTNLTKMNHSTITSRILSASELIRLTSFNYEYHLVYFDRYNANTNTTVNIVAKY